MKRKLLILYADDNASVVYGWKTLLELKGYEVVTATNGAEALQAFLANPIDLALLDYHMPEMNGDIAAAHMKASKADVPVALLSADDLPFLANLKPVDAFVSKSESIARILETVEFLLSRRILFEPIEGLKAGENAA
jgi:CheY-like chemotaxis protein